MIVAEPEAEIKEHESGTFVGPLRSSVRLFLDTPAALTTSWCFFFFRKHLPENSVFNPLFTASDEKKLFFSVLMLFF